MYARSGRIFVKAGCGNGVYPFSKKKKKLPKPGSLVMDGATLRCWG